MNRVIFLLLIIFCPSLIFCQSTKIDSLEHKGMTLVYNMKFIEANDIFDKIIMFEPKNGVGYFLKSVNYYWMWLDNPQNKAIIKKYKEISDSSIDISEEMLDRNENDINAMFYLGGTYGNLGRFYAMNKSWWSAYWDGKKGKNYLKDVVKRDSNYYDAYLGLGIYHYYADVLPKIIKFFSFILGIEGNKELGLQELHLAIKKSKDTRTEAMFFLGAIYNDMEKNYEKALPLFKELFAEYPNNSIFGLALAKCYWELGRYESAKKQFAFLFDKLGRDNKVRLYMLNYAYMLLSKGFDNDAIRYFKKRIEIFPNDPNSYDSLGDGYRKEGKIKLAETEYEKALEIDPNFEASKKKLKELENGEQ